MGIAVDAIDIYNPDNYVVAPPHGKLSPMPAHSDIKATSTAVVDSSSLAIMKKKVASVLHESKLCSLDAVDAAKSTQ